MDLINLKIGEMQEVEEAGVEDLKQRVQSSKKIKFTVFLLDQEVMEVIEAMVVMATLRI